MAEPPSSTQVQRLIRAALLEVHSKRLAGAKTAECLRDAYDACVNLFGEAGEPLTEELLTERIPAIVFDALVERRWIQYPLRRRRGRGAVVGSFLRPVENTARDEEIPQKELIETFGGRKVTAGYGAWFKERCLASPIAYWQAVMLKRAAADDLPTPDHGGNTLPVQVSPTGLGRTKPGPKPDLETARKVKKIVEQCLSPEGWKTDLEAVCKRLDEAEIPFPNTWPKREMKLASWSDGASLEPELAIKAIEYRLEIAPRG